MRSDSWTGIKTLQAIGTDVGGFMPSYPERLLGGITIEMGSITATHDVVFGGSCYEVLWPISYSIPLNMMIEHGSGSVRAGQFGY